jgi:release factor glutamine methyltransferase
MRLAEALVELKQNFQKKKFDNSQREAEILLARSLNLSQTELLLNPEKILSQEQWQLLIAQMNRRLAGEPLAYILGYAYFYKYRFEVNPHVLIPRPETEILVEEALELPAPKSFADLGCGSGCLGLSLLAQWPQSFLTAIDISEEALKVTKGNATNLDLTDRLRLICKDVSEIQLTDRFDMIVSNPPYIDTRDDRIEENVKKYEPSKALFADQDGLEFYKSWTPWAARHLQPLGHLLFEVGAGQAQEVQRICLQNGFKNIKIREDFSGIQRVVIAQKDETHG